MKALHANSQEVVRLVQALGLDPSRTSDITVRIPAGGVVTITATMYCNERGADGLKQTVAQYKLTPLDGAV